MWLKVKSGKMRLDLNPLGTSVELSVQKYKPMKLHGGNGKKNQCTYSTQFCSTIFN